MNLENVGIAIAFVVIVITFILAIIAALKSKNDAKLIEQNYSDVPSDMKLVLHIYRTSITMALFTGILLLVSIVLKVGSTNKYIKKSYLMIMIIVFILSCMLIGMCAQLVKYNKGSNTSNPNNWINLGLATGIFGLISFLAAISLVQS